MENQSFVKKKINVQFITTIIVLIALCAILTAASPYFLKASNIINVIQQVTVNATLAIGMMFVMLTGGIDLSVGSILAFSGILMGVAKEAGWSTFPLIILGIASAVLLGTVNGAMVVFLKLPPFIATLGMLNIGRGLTLVISGGRNYATFPVAFRWIGLGNIPGTSIPVQVIFLIVFYLIAFYVLRYRKFGRYIYALGGNEEAAKLSGINVKLNKFLVYLVSGLTSGLGAIILTSKLNAAQSQAGAGYELDAVAACVIGGTSLNGGKGFIWGTLIGALIIQVIQNGLNLLNVSSYLQQVITGVVMCGAVAIDTMRQKS